LKYTKTLWRCKPEDADSIVGLLSEFPFDTFMETDEGLEAYIPSADFQDPQTLLEIQQLAETHKLVFEAEEMPDVNWNQEWESYFEPVLVDDFCQVRATFHQPQTGFKYDLLINPQMSFGTGHHQTTYLCIKALEKIDLANKSVFDYGCGTGILAILTALMGAKSISGIDIDEWAINNSVENAELNKVKWDLIKQAKLEDAQPQPYDLILANINRNVLLDSAKALATFAHKNTYLITSGYLSQDAKSIELGFEAVGFKLRERLERENWVMQVFEFIK
jgi:ribosomal protein L11 methyltransferase